MTDLSVLASPASAVVIIAYFLIRDAISKKKNNHSPGNPGNPGGLEELHGDHRVMNEKLKALHEDNEEIKEILRRVLAK